MLSAIGLILISKQIPLMLGYDKPGFWTNELFNIVTFHHTFDYLKDLYQNISEGSVVIASSSLLILFLWKKFSSKKLSFIPASFITVLFGILLAMYLEMFFPSIMLSTSQFVSVPQNVFSQVKVPDISMLFSNIEIWKYSIVICFVATLETLLSITAIDKLDPYNRISPPNRELIAQGTGNFVSGMIGGLPITAVIVRSSANAEAGGRTKLSAFTHGIWLFIALLLAIPLLNRIPYAVLAVILFRTGYNLVKPRMIVSIYKQGREQFMPFIITVIAILFSDLLIGVFIGIIYSIYFIIKHTYRAGFSMTERMDGHIKIIRVELALNVSFLNKPRIMLMLDKLPEYSVVEIDGSKCVYIDNDILEIIQAYKSKAHRKHIQLTTFNIPEVDTIELH